MLSDFLARLLREEYQSQEVRFLEHRIRRAHLPERWSLDTYPWPVGARKADRAARELLEADSAHNFHFRGSAARPTFAGMAEVTIKIGDAQVTVSSDAESIEQAAAIATKLMDASLEKQASRAKDCKYAGQEYSTGAPISVGGKTYTCKADGSWKAG